MQNTPEIAFRCGPLALDRIRTFENPALAGHSKIQESKSTPDGLSLTQVAELSSQLGMNYQMAFRQKGARLMFPAVVNWKVGHYAAIMRQENGRYLIQDPTFRNDVWMTDVALEAEASGYFLVPSGPLPAGWRAVGEEEGNAIWGKGVTYGNDPNPTTPDDPKKDQQCSAQGMAVANVHLMVVSLNITDTPVGYRPPVGPPVSFTVTYNQREAKPTRSDWYRSSATTRISSH